MADGPITNISDVVVPEIFTGYSQQVTEEKARIIQSGVLARDGSLDALLSGGGMTFNIPSWKDLDSDEERIASDTSSIFAGAEAGIAAGTTTADGTYAFDPDPKKIESQTEIAIRMNRNQSWSSSNLAAQLAGSDPMNAIADRVAYYWTRRLQEGFISMMTGVIADNDANDSGDYTNDISNGGTFQDGVTNFSAEAFLDTSLTMGDSMEDLTAVMVHSVVYNRMQKNNLIDFIPDASGVINIPTFLGREVLIDDSMTNDGSVYESWLFGAGFARMGVGTPNMATELDRKAGAGNGGGQDVLYNRVEWMFHPNGHKWDGSTASSGGPANSDLEAAGSWDRVWSERKMIKFARLVTTES
ncbi:MAG: hypothetical protein ACR2NF_08910 [Pirellulales bacterium]